jgi:hypothetical protein
MAGGVAMTKKIAMVACTLFVFGCLVATAQNTWRGVVSDSHCGAKHSTPSDEAAACVKKCVEGGAQYVLVSRGTVYKLDAQEKFADFAGKRVRVTGTLSGDTITVSSVEPAIARRKGGKEGAS